MSKTKPGPHALPDPIIDDENPEWTAEDFARAQRPEDVWSPEMLALFPNTLARVRGKGKKPAKVPTYIRLSPDVLEHFKAGGPGWQTRIDETLRAAAGLPPEPSTGLK